MAQVAHVLYCVEVDDATGECITQAWMPAPSLVPPLTEAQTVTIMSLLMVIFCTAYFFRATDKATRGRA